MFNDHKDIKYATLTNISMTLPIGAVAESPPANPWSGKIPHAAEQLSPCATTAEPVL